MGDLVAKKFPQVPYSALYIDVKYSQLLQASMQFLKPSDRNDLKRGIEQLFVKNAKVERLLITVSVRTSLDIILQVMNFEPGSEFLLTAVNIPDMVKIVRYHGLIPVPVEIDSKNLAPTLEDFKKAYKPGKTKAILVSYLFGSRFDATEIFKWAKQEKLMIFEDEAESFNGPSRNGHELADFTFFSFGTIKPLTAFGGAVTMVRHNESVYRKMKQINDSYNHLPNSQYFKKMFKNSVLMWALNYELGHNVSRYILTNIISRNRDYKEYVIEKLRGFQGQENFLETFRFQIPTAMLYLLSLRMHTFDAQRFLSQNQKLIYAQDKLQNNGIQVAGSGNKERTFWLFPIIVPNPQLFFKILVSRGIVGTYLGATQLKLVESPIGNYDYPINTLLFFNNLVYLPIHREVPQKHIDRIIEETIETLKIVKNITGRKMADYPKL